MKLTAHNERNALAVVIIVVAGIILYIYLNYQEFLMDSNDISKFTILAGIVLSLLLVLFYMVSQRADKGHHSAKKSSKKKRK